MPNDELENKGVTIISITEEVVKRPTSNKRVPVKLPPLPEQKPLGVLEKAANAARAVKQIAASGVKLVDKETRIARGKICEKCEFWKKDGNLGLGECTQCGCTKYKRLFAAQNCPIGKW